MDNPDFDNTLNIPEDLVLKLQKIVEFQNKCLKREILKLVNNS